MQRAFVLMNVELGKEEEISKELKKIEEVKEVYVVYGTYDLIAEVEATTTGKLHETIAYKVRRLKDIRSTNTLIVTEGKEETWYWRL